MRHTIQLILYCLLGSVSYFPGNGVFAQNSQAVSGRVLDQFSSTIGGVTVTVKGTTASTVTAEDGSFFLTVPVERAILVFSSVGYRTLEVTYEGQKSLTVSLEPDNTALEEVVVVGYGTQRKRDLTGAISSAPLSAFTESPNTNILQSLSGSTPGVRIGAVSSAGEEPDVRVRGQSTLNGSQDPLIVLDGVYYRGRLADLNPKDIASVDVLKDPSSKAVYGAQAANGVVIVTTKSGMTSDKPIIDYSGYYSAQTPANKLTPLSQEGFLKRVRDIDWQNAYLAPDYIQENPDWTFANNSQLWTPILDGIANGTNFDWLDALTDPG